MTSLLTVIYAIILFSVIIFVHELGHFIFAKCFNVYVEEFAVGMGPAIFKKKWGETLYSIRAIPMGGYCKMEGENEESENPRAFSNKSKIQRLIILCAGAVMNLVLGLLVVILLNGFYSGDTFATTTVSTVIANSPAENAGLMAGDKIISLNGHRVNIRSDFSVYNNKETLDLEIKRNGEKIKLSLTPKSYILDDKGNIVKEGEGEGTVKLIGITFGTEKRTFLNVIKNSFYESIFIGKSIYMSLIDMVSGNVRMDDLSGPVGIVNEINNAAKVGFSYLLYLMAIITINLGIFNLLPIPALDGGRVFFILIEIIIGRQVPQKYEGYVHAIGFLLLILLMLFVTWNDITKIFLK